uniref:Zona pellucida protein AX 4 n=1 Tax=Cynoglossus semilaevis TaxID=244447 RepID=A0A3P8ULC8_CYNSE
MAFEICFSVAMLFSLWLAAECDDLPFEVHQVECRDHYVWAVVELAFAGEDVHFEAVDETGIHPITEEYAAMCGYTASVLPLSGLVELRSSYFSCHTENKDGVFKLNFNLLVTHDGHLVRYNFNKTCTPAAAWSPREITCEVNYMEVSLRNEVTCSSVKMADDWNDALRAPYTSAVSDWQVVFQRAGEQSMPMNVSEARKQGYWFDLMDERLVFRTPYGQPDSFSTEMSGVPVEVVHATLFSRQSWVVIMVDLVAACSMDEGSYDNGYIMWDIPDMLHPLVSGIYDTQVNVGVNGKLEEQPVAEQRGYMVEKHNATVMISIPYNAEGGYRKSLHLMGDLYEYYVFHLYVEQISMDEDDVNTRLRFQKTLATPLLPRPVFTENRTVLEDRVFTVYLGDVPEDVKLTAVQLNGHMYIVPFINSSGHTITEVVHDNHTHDYTVQVPFDHHVVTEQFSREDEAIKHMLDINFTLTVLPENEHFYHHTSVYALTDASPPEFEANCSETGIIFKMDHRPFDYLWFISIGSERLTPELAAEHKYNMRNDSQSLVLEVPLFTDGYQYKNISLKGFLGTFEILVRDRNTSEVQRSTVKTCPFTRLEFIFCSTDGKMTVAADLSGMIPPGDPARSNLMDKYCGPREADETRALFSFPVNSCGSTVRLFKENVIYQNEILYTRKLRESTQLSDNSTEQFESDTVGVGHITTSPSLTEPETTTMKPTVTVTHTTPPTRRTRRPAVFQPAFHPPVRYVRVSPFRYLESLKRERIRIIDNEWQRKFQEACPDLCLQQDFTPSIFAVSLLGGRPLRASSSRTSPPNLP